jgi:glycosyltransferase involved in cell wall biosynthesis
MFLYVTCDRIGSQTGGGIVTANELEALTKFGHVDIINPQPKANPFESEVGITIQDLNKYKLAHFYSGSFPQLTKKLKEAGVKITYTAAAHDIKLSQEEFQKNGIAYDFPHITDPKLWSFYLSSYLNADKVICPSTHSKKVMTDFGCTDIEVIPHGCESGSFKPYPKVFSVGYLGQIGPDKGLRYLIEAWSKLNYKDAILTFAGSQSPALLPLLRHYGVGNYNILGYVKNISEFFNSISVYVQPSVTEGFGIEVLESMSHGRPVIVSDGVGAADCVGAGCNVFPKRDVGILAELINWHKNNICKNSDDLIAWSKNYSWDKIREKYISVWKELLV